MRLSISQKMAGTAIFLLVTTLVIGYFLYAASMPFKEVAIDRGINIPITLVGAFTQDRFRHATNRLIEKWQGRKRHQVARPILGIAGLFAVQGVLYVIFMRLIDVAGPGLLLGILNLLGGATAQWIWQEKWRWIMAKREWGSKLVGKGIAPVQRVIARIATRGPAR